MSSAGGRAVVQALQRPLGAARRRVRVVQREHLDHVGRGGVAALRGAAEPAGFSPRPVAEQLLQEADEELRIQHTLLPMRFPASKLRIPGRYQPKDVGRLGVAAGRAPPEHRQEPRLVPPVQSRNTLHLHRQGPAQQRVSRLGYRVSACMAAGERVGRAEEKTRVQKRWRVTYDRLKLTTSLRGVGDLVAMLAVTSTRMSEGSPAMSMPRSVFAS